MKRAVFTIMAIACAVSSAQTLASSVAYRKQIVLSVPVHVVYVDMNDQNVRVSVAMAKHGRGSSESVPSMVARTKPSAALTGTFFDTRSLLPTGDIVIAGVRTHSGCLGSALCIDPNNNAQIVPHKLRDRSIKAGYQMVVAGGMSIVNDSKVAINPRGEGFSDPSLFRMTRRTAVGVTSTNKLLMVSTNSNISIHRLAKIMVKLGANQAMMLDGGTSTTMYANGRFVASSGRKLTNLLVVYQTEKSYMASIEQLYPGLKSEEQIASKPVDDAPKSIAEDWLSNLMKTSVEQKQSTSWLKGVQTADNSLLWFGR